MRAQLVSLLLILGALGCRGERASAYPYTRIFLGYDEPWIAFEKPPPLVEIEPGIYVVSDHHTAVYYLDGDYWLFDKGVWYRATSWNDAWTPLHPSLVPTRIAYRDHARYVRYRPERVLVHQR